MLNDFENGLCPTCSNSIFCPTWAERKCVVQEKRYMHNGPIECKDFKKRPKNWKDMRCRCEDCLKNDLLDEVEMEE